MQNRQAVDLAKCYRLLNHGPATLITSAHAGLRNVMAASWVMPIDFDPPKMLVVLDKRTRTRELVEASGEFAINLPTRALAQATLAAGSQSGHERDKFADLGFATFAAERVGAPLIEGCLGWLECSVIEETDYQQRYDLFIAEVVAAWADPAAYSNNRWHFPDEINRTIHYLAGGGFFVTGAAFEVERP